MFTLLQWQSKSYKASKFQLESSLIEAYPYFLWLILFFLIFEDTL